ncbi:flavoprotein [gut metagenome]|uniref:Flavoprotein n=1 Tax=gut metagenome TaxID=749906 RepID=J9FYG1_9ZZZZ
MLSIAVVGGGAAGFFSAIAIQQALPDAQVVILERAPKVLAKVKVSGGGRCNLTNSFALVGDLSKVYPRGHRLMKRLFRVFDHQAVYDWFE